MCTHAQAHVQSNIYIDDNILSVIRTFLIILRCLYFAYNDKTKFIDQFRINDISCVCVFRFIFKSNQNKHAIADAVQPFDFVISIAWGEPKNQ